MINHWTEFKIAPTTKEHFAKRVSLTWQGVIVLNGRVVKLLGHPTHAVLYFDQLNLQIGIKAGPADQENAFPLKSWDESASRIIRAKKFCDYNNISVKCTVIFDEPRIDDNGMLVLDLKRTHRSPRLSGPEISERMRLAREREAERERQAAMQRPYQRMFPRGRGDEKVSF